MKNTAKEQRKLRDADFERRMQPRMVWPSWQEGTAIRVETKRGPAYMVKKVVKKKSGARKLTEAEDNAIGRKLRRRTNKALLGWRPYAQR